MYILIFTLHSPLDASKDVGLGANAAKTNYKFMSCHKDVGQISKIFSNENSRSESNSQRKWEQIQFRECLLPFSSKYSVFPSAIKNF